MTIFLIEVRLTGGWKHNLSDWDMAGVAGSGVREPTNQSGGAKKRQDGCVFWAFKARKPEQNLPPLMMKIAIWWWSIIISLTYLKCDPLPPYLLISIYFVCCRFPPSRLICCAEQCYTAHAWPKAACWIKTPIRPPSANTCIILAVTTTQYYTALSDQKDLSEHWLVCVPVSPSLPPSHPPTLCRDCVASPSPPL